MQIPRIPLFCIILCLRVIAYTGQEMKSVTFDQVIQLLTKGDSAQKTEAMSVISYSVTSPDRLWIGRRPSSRIASLTTDERTQLVAILDSVATSDKLSDSRSAALVTMFHLRKGTDAEVRIRRHMETNSVTEKLVVIRLYASMAESAKEPPPDFVSRSFLEILKLDHEEDVAWQCCYVAGLLGNRSPDVLEFLKAAETHPSGKVRRYAKEAREKLAKSPRR